MINVQYLQETLKEQNMTRQEFARQSQIEQSTISRLFSGKRTGSLLFLEGIARCFPDKDLRSFLIIPEDRSSNIK